MNYELTRDNNKWIASIEYYPNSKSFVNIICVGKTKKEAIARLRLELNKK